MTYDKIGVVSAQAFSQAIDHKNGAVLPAGAAQRDAEKLPLLAFEQRQPAKQEPAQLLKQNLRFRLAR